MDMSSIVAGALTGRWDSRELTYGQYSYRNSFQLPPNGGVGRMPLVIHHQHKLPTCTGEAGASLRAVEHYLQTGQIQDFSAMYIYKMNRLYDGLAANVKGSTLRATMQSLQHKGVCRERLYPSTKSNCDHPFPTARQGGKVLLADGAQFKIGDYLRCADLEDMLMALADGHAVIFSMIIYTDFYHADRGLVSREITGEKIGGHSMVAINYDLQQELLEVVQSWGKDPGGPTDRGYMYIPFSWFRKNSKSSLLEAYTMI